MRRQLRALSPIVSVVLLILIAVAASVLIYTWMSGMAAQNPAEETSLKEKLKVEAVKVETGTYTVGNTNYTHKVDAYVRNLGQVPVKIVTIYIINASNGNVIQSNTTANVVIPASAIKPVTIYANLTAGYYVVKVVSEHGIEAVATFSVTK